MNNKNHLPPELDPAEPDPTLGPSHEVGERPGQRPGEEHSEPDVETGKHPGKP